LLNGLWAADSLLPYFPLLNGLLLSVLLMSSLLLNGPVAGWSASECLLLNDLVLNGLLPYIVPW
jgi:hypothetical protein